jgi:hypothetical protein
MYDDAASGPARVTRKPGVAQAEHTAAGRCSLHAFVVRFQDLQSIVRINLAANHALGQSKPIQGFGISITRHWGQACHGLTIGETGHSNGRRKFKLKNGVGASKIVKYFCM